MRAEVPSQALYGAALRGVLHGRTVRPRTPSCYVRAMADVPALTPRMRWEMVASRLAEESRQATYDDKLAQLESLMGSVDDFGWRDSLGLDDDRVRALWMKLRLACSHG